MSRKGNILKEIVHRPWELPSGEWRYYQEWNDALFLHWRIPAEILQKLLPEGLELDLFEGEAWVSVVAFTMEKIRPRFLPALSLISDFHEINVRTYVKHKEKSGVYFISMEGQKLLSVLVSKALSGLPYQRANISRKLHNGLSSYSSVNNRKQFRLEAEYDVLPDEYQPTALDKWLVERYCLFVDIGNELFCYEIHHLPWKIAKVKLEYLKLDYKIGDLAIGKAAPELTHFSEGVEVLAWEKVKLD
ncbi:MAG: DUF2071 domain-containing protein [Bacteroidota bacterium]